MSPNFSKFTHFGQFGTAESRKALADAIYAHLRTGGNQPFESKEAGIHAAGLQQTLSNGTLRNLCAKDESLAERVTEEILENLNRAEKAIKIADAPFEKEKQSHDLLKNAKGKEIPTQWLPSLALLKKTYNAKDLDTSFYEKSMEAANNSKLKEEYKSSPEAVRDHLSDRWKALLDKKELDHQLVLIEQERAKFTKDLYARAEELKKLQDALEPFTQELGRLWDMRKGNWQRVNFDLLKQYAALLQNNEALQQLAEMLGKMRQAETQLEEEIYKDVEIKTVWKVERAQKSELVGIRESNDLNNLIPGETALLGDPELEILFFKRFAEQKLQTYDFTGKIKDVHDEEVERKRLKGKEDSKGPIIICVDTSGSMHGAPETVAKTLCFAILKIALQERRKCYLISFSDSSSLCTLDLTDFQQSLDKLLDFLGMSFRGGTDAGPALQESLRMLETQEYKKADILMISDFVMDGLATRLKTQIATAKDRETKFHSLVIGSSQNAAVIKEFDHNWTYDPSRPTALMEVLRGFKGI